MLVNSVGDFGDVSRCFAKVLSVFNPTSWCRGPEQIVRGDQGAGRQGKQGRPMSGGATDRGRQVLAGLMAEGLGDQVLLLRIYQVCLTPGSTAHLHQVYAYSKTWCVGLHLVPSTLNMSTTQYNTYIHTKQLGPRGECVGTNIVQAAPSPPPPHMTHRAADILSAGVACCVLQGWQEHGYSVEWAREAGLDIRGLRFARDVRRQLEGITGPQGSHLLGTPSLHHRLRLIVGRMWFPAAENKGHVSAFTVAR